MNRNRWIRLPALICALLLLATVAGCNNATLSPTAESTQPAQATQGQTAVTPETTEPETTTLVWMIVGTDTRPDDSISQIDQYLAEKTGVLMTYIYQTTEKIGLLMSAGDLECDIYGPSDDEREQLIAGNLIIPLDDYLSEYGKDIQKNAGTALDFWRTNQSEGTNKLYFLSAQNISDISNLKEVPKFEYQIGPYIRWDYYEELGYPQIGNEDDLLNVLKQIQDAHPTTDDGKKTYGISFFSDWGLEWMFFCPYQYGYGESNVRTWLVNVDEDYNITGNILESDFLQWDALRFYNKAYRLGIFDPESFTQKQTNVEDKLKAGQAFYTFNCWSNTSLNEALGGNCGFGYVPTAFPYTFVDGQSAIKGWTSSMSVSSSCEYPEKAVTWMNYLYTEDGARTVESGIKDVHWTMTDGLPALTDETISKYNIDTDWTVQSGIQSHHSWVGLNDYWICEDGGYVSLFSSEDMIVRQNTAFTDHYNEHFGVTYPGEAVLNAANEGKIQLFLIETTPSSMMPSLTDELSRIWAKIENHLNTNIPKIIMAETEDECNALIDECIQEYTESGAQSIVDWTTENWAECVEACEAYN